MKTNLDQKGIINWNNSYSIVNSQNLWGDDEVPIMKKVVDIFNQTGGKKFMDIPCGDGRNLNSLSEKLDIVIGMDSSQNALNISMARLKHFDLKNVLLTKGDIYDLPFQKEQLDGIFCWDILGHLVTPEKALKSLHKNLKTNGILIGSFFTLNDSTRDSKMVKIGLEEFIYEDQFYFRYYTKTEVETLLSDVGFKIKEIYAYSWNEPPHEGYREYPHMHESWFFVAEK